MWNQGMMSVIKNTVSVNINEEIGFILYPT